MNKFEKITHPVKELPNGDKLNLNIFRISSENEGPHVHIQASVHGAEHQGNAVIYKLMEYFHTHPFNGSITFIPVANPSALNMKVGTWTYGRFNPITGNNWNRNYHDICSLAHEMTGFDLDKFAEENKEREWEEIKKEFKKTLFDCYKKLELTIAKYGPSENGAVNLVLQKLASPSDIMLDLHTGPIACQYLYAAEYTRTSAAHFDADVTLLIPPEFAGAMDEATFVPWVKLKEAFERTGRTIPLDFEAFTVELGSEEIISFKNAEQECARILNYLHKKGVIDEFDYKSTKKKYAGFLRDYHKYTSPRGGLVDYTARAGSIVKKDEEVCRFLLIQDIETGEDLEKGQWSYLAPNDMIIVNHNTSASVGQGAELFYALEKFFEL